VVDKICQTLNQIYSRTEEENVAIRYGLELLFDNVIKVILIFLMGCILRKGAETGCILIAFCTLRSQAGGIHASSNFMCMAGMIVMWAISLCTGQMIFLEYWIVWVVYGICFTIIISYAPNTINIMHYTQKDIYRKKIYATAILTFCILAAIILKSFRTCIVVAVCLETISLLKKGENDE
jgi:accessory gene regulator B